MQGTSNGIKLLTERGADGVKEDLESSTVVGADGAASKVAEAAGWPRQKTVPLVQAIVKLPSDYPPATVRVWFVPDDTPYFYWLIPDAEGRGALGLIGEDGAQTRRVLENFLEKKHFDPLSFQGARIPVYTGWVPVDRTVGGGKVYLVGDAAGQVKVTTVGGIVTGVRGAEGVAEAILNGGRSRKLSSLRRELNLHLLIRKRAASFSAGRLQPSGGSAEFSRENFAQHIYARRSCASPVAHMPQSAAPAFARTARTADAQFDRAAAKFLVLSFRVQSS